MLLLFWKVVGVEVGVIRNIRWYHDESYSPRYLCGADQGLTILNPYISIDLPECSYFQTPAEVKGSCVFENYILAGTPSGVYQISWDTVKQYNCDVYSPQDLSSQSSLSYTTASGLLSDDIIALDALGPYLAKSLPMSAARCPCSDVWSWEKICSFGKSKIFGIVLL